MPGSQREGISSFCRQNQGVGEGRASNAVAPDGEKYVLWNLDKTSSGVIAFVLP